MSRSLAWIPKGPALETYETKIRADLEAVLANIELPEGAPLFLKLYMIGRDEGSANPMVMVCCVDRAIRKEAESSIRESRILDRFPGFGLGSSALLLESHGLEELLTIVRFPTDFGKMSNMLTNVQGYKRDMNSPQSNEDLGDSGSTVEIYGSVPHRLGGAIRFVSISNGQLSAVHAATAGPIFQLGTELYQITAGHGMRFDTPDTKVQYSSSELDECEFDGQSDDNDDVSTSIGSVTPEEFSTQSSDEDSCTSRLSGGEAAKADQQRPVEHAPHIKTEPDGSVSPSNLKPESLTEDYERMYLQLHNLDLDYVLLKVPTESDLSVSTPALTSSRHESKTVTKTSHLGANSARVVVMSPDGPIQGTISPETTSYKMRGFNNLQQLLTVQLDGVFLKGYSGSAVIDFGTGAVYGQITLGHPGQSQAYCVRAPIIFADILSRLGHVPILDKAQWQSMRQYNIQDTSPPLKADPTNTDVSKGVPTSYSGSILKSASPEHKSAMGVHGAMDLLEEKSFRLKRKRASESPQPSKASSRRESAPRHSSQRAFSCPFYLYDRSQHFDCLNRRLKRVSDVRQHLVRAHSLAPQCPICGEEFKEDSAGSGSAEDRLSEHIQGQNCYPLPAPPPPRHGITQDQLEVVRIIAARRNGRRATDPAAEKWFEIWDILFPGTPRPLSPYINDHPDIQRISDMNHEIFASEKWRELTLPTRGSSPSLENASRNTIMTITERLLALYRRMSQHPDQGAPEAISSMTDADTLAASSTGDFMQHPLGWGVVSALVQPSKVTEDVFSSIHTGNAATGQSQWIFDHVPGFPAPGGNSHNSTAAQTGQPLSPFTSNMEFFTNAEELDSIFDFQDVHDSLEPPARPGSPSQFLDKD